MPDTCAPFYFLVKFDGGESFGGFAGASGLGEDSPWNGVTDRLPRITLKQGVLSSDTIFEWLRATGRDRSSARRSVTVTLVGESGKPMHSWYLRDVIPTKFKSPALAAKGGGDLTLEELVLSADGLSS